jgi:AraC family transcriptional regulator
MFAGGLPRPRLGRVLEYIQANLDQGIHIDELAGAAGLSLFHFAKLFKRSTGSSPHQYVLERRLERAKELLRKTGLSLSEIALQAGFADQSHLTNVFRRFIGVTPSQFRTLL